MQQAGAAGGRGIDAQFRSQHAGNVCNLNGMEQDILSITRAVMQAAEQAD